MEGKLCAPLGQAQGNCLADTAGSADDKGVTSCKNLIHNFYTNSIKHIVKGKIKGSSVRLSDVVIILCRPSEPGNVGAVCRAMKNMGLSRLRLVLPHNAYGALETPEGKLLDVQAVRSRAVHAVDVWEGAQNFAGLEEAVADCGLVIGTTRRRGRHRKQVTLTPGELAALLRERPDSGGLRDGPQNGSLRDGSLAGLVFGNERTGLEDSELALCSLASHIPVDEAFPSLNLSHAVQIYAYELYRALSPAAELAVEGQWVPLDRAAIDAQVLKITNSLETLGFYKQRGREEQERFFRDLISRAALSDRECTYFSDIIAKAARLAEMHGSKSNPVD
jgi:tRNA/rRNA methyltransferase/tRNA (cytidine32/uridine32-2'-O)-methyltransferase